MKQKTKYILPAVSFLLFLILIVLLKNIGLDYTGVGTTKIGLSEINLPVRDLIGTNAAWYSITEITGLISIASGGIFAFLGLLQLIKRKSLLKVDKEILSLGGLYIITGLIYVFFEKVIINYRPLLTEGETVPEASFPSSHTVLAVIVAGSIFLILGKYIKNKPLLYTLKSLCAALAVITVAGRMLSGVHWLTDILGGILLSISLLSLFYAIIKQ